MTNNEMRISARVDVLVTAKSSISHIGNVNSIQATFHREEFVKTDFTVVQVPTITGNAMRGLLRDHAMLYMLEKLNLTVPLEVFYALFSGGSLTQKDAGLRDLSSIPAVSVFGSAIGQKILAGRVKIGKVYPIVYELTQYLPQIFTQDPITISAFDITQTEYYTRKDDAKDNRLVQLIQHDKKSKSDDPQQMRYAVETIKAGTRMSWWFAFDRASELEVLAFYSALQHWAASPYVGGKSAVGHGEVSLRGDNGFVIDGLVVALPVSLESYDEYLHANASAIAEVLGANKS